MGLRVRFFVVLVTLLLALQSQTVKTADEDKITQKGIFERVYSWYSYYFPGNKEVNLKVSDIGHYWVYLTWNKVAGELICNDETYINSIDMTDKTSMNISFETEITYKCSIVSEDVDLSSNQVEFTLGFGIAKSSDHNKVIAHYVGDKNSARFSCTVMNYDVQTDTVWSITYKGSEQIQIVHDDDLFKISGDRRQSSSESNFNYGNYLDIIDCSVEKLDGAVISCGSYVNRSQVDVSMLFVCDKPSVMSESIINVWEGCVSCSIDVMTSNLKASKTELLKDGRKTRGGISVNGFSITFDEVKKEDAGNYSAEFCIPCHKDSSPKCFNHTFYLNVMYEPTLSEVTTNYSFFKGERGDVVLGENDKSNPEAVVTWTTPQNVTMKNSTGRYTINSGPDKVQLSIFNVSERDNGTWTVTVEVMSTETFKNCSDQNSLSRKKDFLIQVIVVVPPSEPQSVYVTGVNTTTALVTWDEPSNHGSPHLTGYRLCYNSTCTPLIQNVSAEITLIQGKIYNISVYALSTSDKTTGKSRPGTIMFTMDYVHNLEVTDIGYDWVYLSWDKLDPSCVTLPQYYNISCTCSESSLNFTTMKTSYNIADLPTNVQVNCSVVAISSDNTPCSLYSSIVTSPGAGIVKEFSDHNKVIAHFVGDKNSTRLSCTVMNGDVQTDTVWSVTYRDGKQIQITQDNNLFKLSGDIHQSSLDSNFFNYGNYLDIIDCSMKELDGAVISCGSYVNRSQENFSRVFVCDKPSVMSESIINVWEGHVGCSIDIMTSNLNASKFELLKDGHKAMRDNISVNGFSITFNKIMKDDTGNYFAEFCIPCHKDSSPKCFNHTFYLNVMYGPTISEVRTKYSFSKGEQVELIIGKNLESNPEAVVTWTTPQGETLKHSNGHYIVSSGPDEVQLSIFGVSERDNGTWTVTVEVLSTETFKNCSDQNSSSRKKVFLIQLIVVVPPSKPRNSTVEEINNSKLLVRWEEPLNHGSPYLFGYELCYNSTCEQTVTTIGPKLSPDRGKLYNISVYAISKSDNTTGKSPPTTMMFTMDYVHDFKVVDIGHNWVYLSWDKLNPSCGTISQHYNISCMLGETPLNFTTMETSYNISELSTNVSISCSVAVISSDNAICSLYSPHIITTPGVGIVSKLSDHNRVIAHFVGDKNSARLSCTVMNGDVQTDTVWSVKYNSSEQIQIVHNDELFKVSGDKYRNYLDIIDCSIKELDGVVISCGSYVNPSQVNVSMLFVCDEPSVMSESTINVWEGHFGCSIDVMATDLNARNFSLLKDKQNTRGGISVNGFSVDFNKIMKDDTGNYFAEFCIPCHKDSSPKCFNHTFYLNVMYGPTMLEVETKYLFSGGDQADLVIGENLKSNPEAVVTWTTPQGETFKESNGRYHNTMSSGPDKVQLSISDVSERDNGTWTVTVEVLSTGTFKNCSDQNSSSRKKKFHIQVIVVVPPSEPRNIDVEQLNTTTVSVSWTEPSSRGSPHLTGYTLCYNSTCTTTLDSYAFNGVEINLDEGKLYVITVYAISKSDNITRESRPATKMFTMGATTQSTWTLHYMIGIGITTVIIYGMYMRRTSKRSKPGRPKPSQVLEDSVELIWEQPDATANSFAVFYRSEHDPVSQWNREDTNITEARIEGLSANTTYTFKVCSLLKGKPGPESEISEPITTRSAPHSTKVIVIAKPYASEVTDDCITLVWDTTENVNDDEVYTYTVLYRCFEERHDYWNELPEATQLNSSNVEGLLPQTKYVFKIRADSGGEWSTESDVSDPIETRESEKSERHPKRTLAQYLKSHSQQLYSEDTKPNTFCPITTRIEGEINKCIVNADPNVSTNEFEIPIGEKVLMLVGATGAGKSSLINGITNYIMGVEWKDDFRFKVVVDEDKTSQAFSQTTKITTYSFQGSNLPYTLTVIDTPGFGDTRGMDRDKTIVEQIQSLFSRIGSTAFDQIHGIGFVVQASSPRLTHTQRYVFDSVLSVFGKDIESNIFLLITFADGQEPPVLSAINTAGIPHEGYFQFNNSALYAEASGTVNEMFWNLGRISFERFFAEFEKAEPCSLLLTRENLHERQKLEAIVEGLKLQIQVGLSKINILRQKQRILRKRETEILQNQHFTYELTVTKQRKIDVPSSAFVTNCLQCNFTCHYPCPVARNEEKYRCKAMDGGGPDSANCTVCPGNCHWSQHTNASFRYELYYEVEVQTSDDLKKNLSDALEGKSQIEATINDIERELDMLQRAIVGMVKEAKQSLERLQEIALKPNPLSETEYIDLLIKTEKHEKSLGFTERIKAFEVIKTMVQEQGVVGGEKKIKSSWWKQIMD